MNCSEFQEQVAAFALRAVDPAEHAELAAHLSSAGPHTGCQEAYAKAVETVVQLSAALPPMQPSDRVWQSIEAKLGVPAATAPRRGSTREVVAWALAAAAIIAAIFVSRQMMDGARRLEEAQGTVARLQKEADDTRNSLEGVRNLEAAEKEQLAQQARLLDEGDKLRNDLLALLDAPGTEVIPFKPVKGAQVANAIVNAKQKRAIVISKLAVVTGKDYELWVIRGKNKPTPAGLMRMTSGGVAIGEVRHDVLAQGLPDAFAVSLEKAGGVETPTDVLLVGPVKRKS